MSVFSKIRGFFSRHRNKFIIGGALITGTVILTRYAQQKLRDWQENEAKEFLEKSRKQQHFESTERTCNQTILSLINNLNEALLLEINTEEIVAKLRSNPDDKLQLWEDLKVMVFTRASALIYMTVILVITLRIQLNILGGHLYKDSTSIPQNVQEEYLLLCENLMKTSMKRICEFIKQQYINIIGTMELKKPISLKDLENTFWALQTAISTNESNPINNLSNFVITDESAENGIYSEMIRDTADLLDSDEVKRLATHCISRGFIVLNDNLAEYYTTKSNNNTNNGFVHPTTIQIPLAKLIPIFNGLFAKNLLPDGLIQMLIGNDKIQVLGANIYESFSFKK